MLSHLTRQSFLKYIRTAKQTMSYWGSLFHSFNHLTVSHFSIFYLRLLLQNVCFFKLNYLLFIYLFYLLSGKTFLDYEKQPLER